MKDITIIGGGLAGLINAIELAKKGFRVLLIEKKQYPFHRVCGEYISREVIPFLQSIDCYPHELQPAAIDKFMLTSVDGKKVEMPLDLGGFGISRYAFDNYLVNKALAAGAEIWQTKSVENLSFQKDANIFSITIKGGQSLKSKLVIGAFGKRSTLDARLNRSFLRHRSPYLGVKYHVKTDYAPDVVALHNFKGGYCGISKVENEFFNLCYLSHSDNLKMHGSINQMEEAIVCENPHLRNIWLNSDFVLDKSMVINEISFEKKSPVDQHVFMSGDSAGMITPLCGNGMAMAIHSAHLLSSIIAENGIPKNFSDRMGLEKQYTHFWNNLFATRLWIGRNTQKLFGGKSISKFAVKLAKFSPILAKSVMKKTHGKEF